MPQHQARTLIRTALVVCAAAAAAGCNTVDQSSDESDANGQASAALVTCITLRRGQLGDVYDAFLSADYPTWNTGNSSSLWSGLSSGGGLNRPLFGFDLSPIPAQSTVTSATFRLNVSWNEANNQVYVHRLLAPWDEATATTASYDVAVNADPVAVGSFAAGDVGQKSVDLTNLASAWVSGSLPNHGIVLQEAASANHLFWSSESSSSRPSLQVCYTGCVPSAEVCDGADNDCDGLIDEDNAGGGGTCATGALGACSAGTLACSGGALSCVAANSPSAEVCDGVDNDCDGAVDNGNPGGGFGCTTGAPGVCSPGILSCAGGALVCVAANSPSAEVCDGLDNDCNGVVDNGNPGGGSTCATGTPGVCSPGVLSCVGGAITCVANSSASAEVCDGLDNDCNGAVDNGNPGGGGTCTTGTPGVCSPGILNCSGGALTCVANAGPSAEVCDGLDNDCNGTVDNGNPGGGASCNTGALGVCNPGKINCVSGALGCVANTSPSAEVCDGLDNNCNGTVDEGNPVASVPCNTGKKGVCAVGATSCSGGAVTCVQTTFPSLDVCDGLDNNCDGNVDEQFQCYRRIFVSSVAYNGNLGGLAGADTKCSQVAFAGHLTGTYKAWLSDSTTSAASRLTHSPLRYQLVNGTVVANNWTQLTSGTLLHAIDMNESFGPAPLGSGACFGEKSAWTNTEADGTIASTVCNGGSCSCQNWTNATPAFSSVWGKSAATDTNWSHYCGGGSCGFTAPLICIEQN